jgi:hypothetical protein
VTDELEQDHLRDVLGVGFLELPPQAPGMDLRAVAVDKRGPGGLIARLIAQGKGFGSMASESPSFLGTSGETWAS